MVDVKSNEVLWVEKYRPQKIDDTILPEKTKTAFKKFVSDETIPNLLLTGTPGVGKTTIAKAMLDELGCDYIVKNGSLNVNIDSIRYDISTFASAVSLTGGRKYVIFDEADYLNATSVQPALRNFIEEYSSNCGFIFTCNFKNRIIDPLHSRCSVIEFNIAKKDSPKLCAQFLDRCCTILSKENVTYEKPVVAELIMKYLPDWRRVLNELQRYSVSNTIDSGILTSLSEVSINNLMSALKNKDFKKMRQWVTDNIDQEPAALFRKLYDNMYEYVEPQSIPQLVLILADYQYKNSFVADHEINMVACCTEIMAGVQFK